LARITRALNEAGVPSPSATDPGGTRTTQDRLNVGHGHHDLVQHAVHRRQVWNRQRSDTELADPCNVMLGYRSVQRWNLPDGWVISSRPAYLALVSEADFIAAQDVSAVRGPAPQGGPVLRRYLLAGLLACGVGGRRMESAWSNDRSAYRSLRCAGGPSGCPGLGDLGDHTGLRADIRLYPQAELAGQPHTA
jgi:site-specific DNA recombinase